MTIPADWSIGYEDNGRGDIKLHDPRGVCPHCHNPSTFKITRSVNDYREFNHFVYSILQCNSASCCGFVFIASSVSQNLQIAPATDLFHVYPPHTIDKPHIAIPEFIAEDWIEAQKAMEAGAPKAAAVMCRRVLYDAILDKKCKERPLIEGLKQLIEEQRLPRIFDNWLPAIMDDGHDAAHPHRALEVDPTNIVETMEYTSELLRNLYVVPYDFQQRIERNQKP